MGRVDRRDKLEALRVHRLDAFLLAFNRYLEGRCSPAKVTARARKLGDVMMAVRRR